MRYEIRCECGLEAEALGWVPGHGEMIECPKCGRHVKNDRRPHGHLSAHEINEWIKSDGGTIGNAKVESFGAQIVKTKRAICTHGFPVGQKCPFCSK